MFTIFRNWWLIAFAFAAVCHGQNTYGGSATGPKDVEIPIPLVPSGSYQQEEHPRDIVLAPTMLRRSGNGGYGGSASGIVVPSDVPNTYGGAIAIDFNCVDLANGNYPDPKDRCNTFYYVCSAYRASKIDCPKGLYFDPDNNMCEEKMHVPVCGGIIRTTSAILSDAETYSTSNFDCTENEDGYYPNPSDKCSPIYYSCSGGRAKELHCQEGLFFDPDTNACELKENTYVCTGTRPTQAPLTYGGTTPNYPIDCKGKEDGIYADPTEKCSSVFYVCSRDTVFMFTCAGNTFFDDKADRCDIWMNVFACSGMEPQQDDTYSPPIKPADFDCSTLSSGSYPDPKSKCSTHYYVCANGIAYEMYCPDTLHWDPDESVCKSFDDIYACTGTTKGATTPTTAYPFVPADERIPEYDCSDKADGFYADPSNKCSSIYYACSNKRDHKMYCPEGLYFESESTLCLAWSHVYDCSGKHMEVTYPSVPHDAVTEQVPIDCHGLEDGDYPDPENKCSQIYYSCSGTHGFKRTCAGNTYFDTDFRLCDTWDNVFACSGHQRPPTTTFTPHDVEIYPFDCTMLYNGIYPAGDCESYYWSCVGGVTHKTECPFGLRYDIEMNTCDLKVYIPKCGGQRTAPTLQTYQTTEPAWPIDCHKLIDGAYSDPSNPCDHSYYVCHSSRTVKLDCPGLLFFDVERNRCDIKKRITACGGSPLSDVPKSGSGSYHQSSYQQSSGILSGNDLQDRSGNGYQQQPNDDISTGGDYQSNRIVNSDLPQSSGYQSSGDLKISDLQDQSGNGYQQHPQPNDDISSGGGYQSSRRVINSDLPRSSGYQSSGGLKTKSDLQDQSGNGYQQQQPQPNDDISLGGGYQSNRVINSDLPQSSGYQSSGLKANSDLQDRSGNGYQQQPQPNDDISSGGSYQSSRVVINSDLPQSSGHQSGLKINSDFHDRSDGYQESMSDAGYGAESSFDENARGDTYRK